MDYTIDMDRRIIRVTAGSTVTPEHVLSLRRSLESNPRVKPHMNLLVDLRPTSNFVVTPAQLRELADSRGDVRTYREGMRVALVGNVAGSFTTARLYEGASAAGRSQIRAFSDVNFALAWLRE